MISFNDPTWSYFLGVVHGDGHISTRSVTISVSYKEPIYVDELTKICKRLGYRPKLYRPRSAYRLDIHNSALTEDLRLTKSRGIWTIPEETHIGPYLAGIIDTDGHTTKPPQRQVIVTLKRSGNLDRLVTRLSVAGLRCNPVKKRTSSFNGKPYEIEEARWAGGDQIEWIANNCELRHPRKAARLRAMAQEVATIKAHVPLWRLVADWLQEVPRDVEEIMARFSLTKRQTDSAMGNIKALCDIEIIPPPRILTKYLVRKRADG